MYGGDGQDAGEVTRGRALTVFPGMALVAGLLGGMLGIGGGMIMNPLLIETGMHPQVMPLAYSMLSGFTLVGLHFLYSLSLG